MRILHLGKYYAPEPGGIERYTQALAEASVAAGDEVAVLVHQRPGHWRSSAETMAGVRVHRSGCLAAPVYTPLSPAFPVQLGRILRSFRPELLHLHFPNPSCFAVLASPGARRLPWLVHWHADVPPDGPDWRLRLAYRAYRPFEQAVLARAGTIVATSRSYLQASGALAPWRDKAAVVPLGVATTQAGTPPGARAPAWPAGTQLKLLAVGRLSYYKGFGVLLDALARTEGAGLVLIGRGECERELEARAEQLGIRQRVVLAGAVDDATLAAAYAAADAFVLPSLDRSEAFGTVLLEAMQAGLPVVASRIPGSGVGEVVADGASGLLVPPGDSDALATALRRMGDPGLRRAFGHAGLARWRERYTLESSVSAMRALYQRIRR